MLDGTGAFLFHTQVAISCYYSADGASPGPVCITTFQELTDAGLNLPGPQITVKRFREEVTRLRPQ